MGLFSSKSEIGLAHDSRPLRQVDFSQVTAEEDEWWPQTEKDDQVRFPGANCLARVLLSIRILMCCAWLRGAGRRPAGLKVALRGLVFLDFLMAQPYQRIAVVSHRCCLAIRVARLAGSSRLAALCANAGI